MKTLNRSLLIGNGVNRLSNASLSWEDILEGLVQENNFPKESLRLIPNTIFFECIKLQSLSMSRASEAEAQQQIAGMLAKIQPSEYHTRFIHTDVKHILTTNYDYCLENTINAQVTSSGNETRYSLFRRKEINGTTIWHIHGEIDHPQTIMLGFDHYAGYLQKMRKHLVGERESDEEKTLASLANRLTQPEPEYPAWVEIFLRTDVDIVGLTLDFTEIDLWWLLGLKKMIGIARNGIARETRYIHFSTETESRETHARLEALKLYGVGIVTIPVTDNHWGQAYDEYLTKMI